MGLYQRLTLSGLCWTYLLALTSSLPTPAKDMTMDGVMDYLEKFHYMGPNHPDSKMRDMMETNMTMAVESGLMMFQEVFSRWGLNMTGKADKETMELMAKPRCGLPDVDNMGDMMKRRKKRYLLQGGTWDHSDITYRVDQYPQEDLTDSQVDSQLQLAFQVWEKVTGLRFYRLPIGNRVPDIIIKFVPSIVSHGDGYPFDGESGTLAHAFYPQGGDIGGDAHFDEAETWSVDANGINLFIVAAHEFGHSLGLGHSSDPEALMAPFYSGYTAPDDFELSYDDTAGIQEKYRAFGIPNPPQPTIKPPTPQPTVKVRPPTVAPEATTPMMMPDGMVSVCKEGIFDTITTMLIGGDYQTVAFKGDNYFMIEDNGGIFPGYPKRIQDEWPELDSDLDASVFLDATYDNEWIWNAINEEWVLTMMQTKPASTLFFKGDQYWMMEEGRIKPDFPRNVGNDLGFPNPIDAIFQWNRNGNVYIFIGRYYYKYTDGIGFASGYPKHIRNWGDLPEKLDAAFQHKAGNGSTVFFSGNQYYLYDDEKFEVKEGYPAPTEPYWLQCDKYISGAANLHPVAFVSIVLALFAHVLTCV